MFAGLSVPVHATEVVLAGVYLGKTLPVINGGALHAVAAGQCVVKVQACSYDSVFECTVP